MKLQHIPVPLWSPPHEGPWRVRWTRPSGESGLSVISYRRRGDAQHDADLCARTCREGCAYDVVPDPGGARWTFG